MIKKLSLIVAGVAFATVMVMNFQDAGTKVSAANLNLAFISQVASAGCEQGAGLPGGAMPCKKVWCSSTFSYGGCGGGNGTTCDELENC